MWCATKEMIATVANFSKHSCRNDGSNKRRDAGRFGPRSRARLFPDDVLVRGLVRG